MILIPTMGMLTITSSAGVHRWQERQTSATISRVAERMEALMTARAAVDRESVPSMALMSASEFDIAPELLTGLFGVDFDAALADARDDVDVDRLVQTEPALSEHLDRVLAVRRDVDEGTVSSVETGASFDSMIDAIDGLWLEAEKELQAAVFGGSISGEVRRRHDALLATRAAFVAGSERLGAANALATGLPAASVRALVEFEGRQLAATELFHGLLGAEGTAAHRRFHADPAVQRFDAVVHRITDDAIVGRTSPLVADKLAYGVAFVDSAAWIDRSSEVVSAASADLSAAAAAAAQVSNTSFWQVMFVAAVVIVLSLLAVALFSRWFTRPLDRIATVVQAVRDGAFDIPRVLLHGPRELSDTVDAINDMAASIDESSHDAITGLLNRRAALDAVGRDLARANRDGNRVMAIFLDLDGLKEINDEYGHQSGDRAIALVAEALRQTCRDADVVARIGGDEFLVAGVVRAGLGGGAEQAERIREAVGRSVLWCEDIPITLRCSVGVAVNQRGSLDVEALIADADTAMYEMKVAGRTA